jgi:hypothetical protein
MNNKKIANELIKIAHTLVANEAEIRLPSKAAELITEIIDKVPKKFKVRYDSSSSTLICDSDAIREIEAIASDAAKYFGSIKKRAKAQLAEAIRSAVARHRINELHIYKEF